LVGFFMFSLGLVFGDRRKIEFLFWSNPGYPGTTALAMSLGWPISLSAMTPMIAVIAHFGGAGVCDRRVVIEGETDSLGDQQSLRGFARDSPTGPSVWWRRRPRAGCSGGNNSPGGTPPWSEMRPCSKTPLTPAGAGYIRNITGLEMGQELIALTLYRKWQARFRENEFLTPDDADSADRKGRRCGIPRGAEAALFVDRKTWGISLLYLETVGRRNNLSRIWKVVAATFLPGWIL
jgi:hypothetical protein